MTALPSTPTEIVDAISALEDVKAQACAHAVETVLPSGHRYVTTAPAAPRPAVVTRRSDLEWRAHALVLIA